MKLFLYYIGKPRDRHANAMAQEYVKRASRFASCEMREIDPRRFDPWTRHPTASHVPLDPTGRKLDSAAFTALVQQTHDLVFLIGGADGLPAGWREKADRLLSLTPLTLPHELARVVLAEQIYRALATIHRHPYPRH